MDIEAGAFELEVANLVGRDYAPGLLEVRGDTPVALLSLGLPDLPMHHTRAHAAKEMAPADGPMRGHGVRPSTLASLPRLLEDPVAVVESRSRAGVLMVVLDSATGPYDEPLTAIIDPGAPLGIGAEAEGRTNFILSVYGRARVIGEVSEAVAAGDALLYDGPRFWSLAAKCTRPGLEVGGRRPGAPAMGLHADRMGTDGRGWVKMGSDRHRPRH